MKNVINEERDLIEKVSKIEAAIYAGCKSYGAIAMATSIPNHKVKKIIQSNMDLKSMYKVRKGMLADQAAANIETIVNDPKHPKHFDASKLVLQKYKSELDENLDAHDPDSLEISGEDDDGKVKRVNITFK